MSAVSLVPGLLAAVGVSAVSVVVGILLAVIAFVLIRWVLSRVGFPYSDVVAVIVAVLVFLGFAFGGGGL